MADISEKGMGSQLTRVVQAPRAAMPVRPKGLALWRKCAIGTAHHTGFDFNPMSIVVGRPPENPDPARPAPAPAAVALIRASAPNVTLPHAPAPPALPPIV